MKSLLRYLLPSYWYSKRHDYFFSRNASNISIAYVNHLTNPISFDRSFITKYYSKVAKINSPHHSTGYLLQIPKNWNENNVNNRFVCVKDKAEEVKKARKEENGAGSEGEDVEEEEEEGADPEEDDEEEDIPEGEEEELEGEGKILIVP